MVEVWRPIPGWPYEASSEGRIRRSEKTAHPTGAGNTHIGKILSPGSLNGYRFVNLFNGDRKWLAVRVHRLVALAFIGPAPEGTEVNHINAIPSDNRPENLEYVTHRENIRHAAAMGRMGTSVAAREKIEDLSKMDFFTAPEIADLVGTTNDTVLRTADCAPTSWLREYRILRFLYRVYGSGRKLGLSASCKRSGW